MHANSIHKNCSKLFLSERFFSFWKFLNSNHMFSVNLVPRAFPSKNGWAPPIFWGKSPGDEVGYPFAVNAILSREIKIHFYAKRQIQIENFSE